MHLEHCDPTRFSLHKVCTSFISLSFDTKEKKMKKSQLILLLVVILNTMVKTFASTDFDAFPGVSNERDKRAISRCFRLKYADSECGGSIRDTVKLIKFPIDTLVSKCFETSGSCLDITTIRDICRRELPTVSCRNDLFTQGNCGDDKWPVSYVNKLCSEQGLMLAAEAMTS